MRERGVGERRVRGALRGRRGGRDRRDAADDAGVRAPPPLLLRRVQHAHRQGLASLDLLYSYLVVCSYSMYGPIVASSRRRVARRVALTSLDLDLDADGLAYNNNNVLDRFYILNEIN